MAEGVAADAGISQILNVNKDLRVAWYNCAGGLIAKIDVIKFILSDIDIDVLFVSEAEIKPDTDLALFNVAGYEHIVAGTINLKFHARSSAFFKSFLGFKATVFDTEVIALTNDTIRLVGVYRQFKLWPGQTHLSELEKMLTALGSLHSNKLTLVGGDFNIYWSRKFDSSYHSSSLLTLLEEWADNYTMSQVVKNATRHRAVIAKTGTRIERSCIDLLFVSDTEKVNSELIPGISSDHDILVATINGGRSPDFPRSKVLLRDWRNYSCDKVLTLSCCRPIRFDPKLSVDEWSGLLDSTLLSITDEVAPFRVI